MSQPNPALIALFTREFELCRVKPGESIAIVTEPDSPGSYLVASIAALSAMGARPFQVMLPVWPERDDFPVVARASGGCTLLRPFPEIVELLKKTGMVVDLTIEGLIHSPETDEILKAGSRMLYIREPADALARLIATEERTRRIDRAVELIRAAREMTVTSKAGTKFRADLRGARVTASRGFSPEPGRWSHWGQGLVAAHPLSTDVEGDLVLCPGDIVYPFGRYVQSQVIVRFKNAFVEAIEGEGLDAELMRDYLRRWNDPDAYGISHIGWGMHERALWHALEFYGKEALGIDARAFEGNFLFSTGPNHHAGRYPICHFDIPMRNCSVFLDGTPTVIEGTIVEPSIARTG
jgi:2,5-dihydroxypyridine 5,6-dioxygenase